MAATTTESKECELRGEKHVLIVSDLAELTRRECDLQYYFYGKIFTAVCTPQAIEHVEATGGELYAVGNISEIMELLLMLPKHTMRTLNVVRQFAWNYNPKHNYINEVQAGTVPILIQGVGVLFPQLWPVDKPYFDRITKAHQMQTLTESNKTENRAFRKGAYLSEVKESKVDGSRSFHLMRCSTNFDGPTLGFDEVDREVVDNINGLAHNVVLSGAASANHVLAQVYHNDSDADKKARISEHSDKTKDMPRNGFIAFCTFYDKNLHLLAKATDATGFDYVPRATKGGSVCTTSVLSELVFRLKDPEKYPALPANVTVQLPPNSVLIIPLSTNRRYTHAIRPSVLPARMLPTRLGYVVRCSNAEAVHRDGQTYFVTADGKEEAMQPMTDAGLTALRAQYLQENRSSDPMTYGVVNFSMNSGDYTLPELGVTTTCHNTCDEKKDCTTPITHNNNDNTAITASAEPS